METDCSLLSLCVTIFYVEEKKKKEERNYNSFEIICKKRISKDKEKSNQVKTRQF